MVMWRFRSIDIMGIAAEWKGEICMFIIICLQCYYHTYVVPGNEIDYMVCTIILSHTNCMSFRVSKTVQAYAGHNYCFAHQ